MKRTSLTVAAVATLIVAAGCGGSNPAGTSSPGTLTSPATASPTTTSPTPATTSPPPATVAPTQGNPSTGVTVVSSRVAYPWGWPGPMAADTAVRHTPKVPPVPELVRISVGEHPATRSSVGYDRIAFTFTEAFPSSDFWYSATLLTVGAGSVIPRLPGTTWLGVSFTVAQAHTSTGASSIRSQPPRLIGGQRIVTFVQAGDFEGGLNYGIGVRNGSASTARIPVRVLEVQTSVAGQHLYTVAFDFAM
jgi:hypothetical protein